MKDRREMTCSTANGGDNDKWPATVTGQGRMGSCGEEGFEMHNGANPLLE